MNPLEQMNLTLHTMVLDLQAIRFRTDAAPSAAQVDRLDSAVDAIAVDIALLHEKVNRLELLCGRFASRLTDRPNTTSTPTPSRSSED